MANWTPDSAVGDMFRAVGRRVPPPQGVSPAVAWGDEAHVRSLLGDGCSELRLARRTCAWRYPSLHACLEHFRTWYGPTVAAFAAVGEDGRAAFEQELMQVFADHNTAGDGTLAIDVPYLEVVGIRS
jgi:hypothetical protein